MTVVSRIAVFITDLFITVSSARSEALEVPWRPSELLSEPLRSERVAGVLRRNRDRRRLQMNTTYDDMEDLIEIRAEELAEEKFGTGYADLSADDRTWIR